MAHDEILFLSVEDVIHIHADTISREGGASGVRDRGLLESAVLMPQQIFGGSRLHLSIEAMAGAYLFHICQAHAFYDGNKRTAAMSMLVFLDQNGFFVDADAVDLEELTLDVASSKVSKHQVIAWMEVNCKRI